MANTFTQLFIHIIFAVKGRQNIIPTQNQEELFKYISGIVKNKGNKLFTINGMPDHIHLLLGLNPNDSLSLLVKEIKRCSTLYINSNNWIKGKFEWQTGYGAFSYSKSQIDQVYKYIENQKKHHKQRTFREEYIELLKKFEINYDIRYIFDEIESD